MLRRLFLISCLIISFSCSKNITSYSELLQSSPVQKELIVLQEIENSLDKNLTLKEQERLLLNAAKEFKTIKRELNNLKTENDTVKEAIDVQLKLCGVYEIIEKDIKENGINSARKYLINAEKSFQDYLNIIEKLKNEK